MWRFSLPVVLLLSLFARPALAQLPSVTLWGDFSGDGVQDRLDIFQNPNNWKVSLGGLGRSTIWLAGWGPGLRNHVGDYDGDGRADVLIYVPARGWHLLTSTGSAFVPHLDTNPGFGAGTRECAANYDYDPASELILEGYGNSTCWQWNAATDHFDWKTCSRVCNAPRPFVFTEGATIYKDTGTGFTPYFVKGMTYMGCRNVPRYSIVDGGGVEHSSWALFFYRDCPETLVFPDFQDMRTTLGINTVRVLTPARNTEYPNPWEDWYNADGAISATAKAKLGKVFDVARSLNMKIHLVLQLQYLRFGDVPVGSPEEAFWLRYITSVGAWLKNEPALFGYEVASEGMLRCDEWPGPCNYWVQDGWEAHTLSFYTRMMRALRAADGNHVITSGQVATPSRDPYNTAWHYPVSDFALLPDVDNLVGGQPFSLFSQVDFVAPHVYAASIPPPKDPITAEETAQTMRDIKAALDRQPHPKPYVLTEVNFANDPLEVAGQPGAPTPGELAQGHFFDLATAELERAGANGMMVWDGFPQLRTIPGTYRKLDQGPYPGTIEFFSPPHPVPRKILVLGGDIWNILYWDLADKPAAPFVRNYFNAH